MDQFSGGANWSMIPNVQAQGNFGTPANHEQLLSNHEQLFLQQQQQQLQQQQFHQQQLQPPTQEVQQFQQFQLQQQFIQQQQYQQQQQRLLQSPPSQPSSLQSPPTVVHTPQSMMQHPPQQLVQTPVQTPQQHQSLASHFHLLSLAEKLSDTVENGSRDQNSDALVTELNSHFDKCQQLLNSISGSLGSKTMTVDGQKRSLEESEILLQLRRDLIVEYRKSIEELVKGEP